MYIKVYMFIFSRYLHLFWTHIRTLVEVVLTDILDNLNRLV